MPRSAIASLIELHSFVIVGKYLSVMESAIVKPLGRGRRLRRRSGTTTIASGLAVMLARLRPDRLLVITTDDPERSQFAQLTSPAHSASSDPRALERSALVLG